MPRLSLVFMGSPEFALPTLDAVARAGHEIACVYTQPPRPAGRGQKERPSPVHAAAEKMGLDVRTPKTLKDPAEERAFAALDADAAVVAAYGLILPNSVLAQPRLGCVNVHASLLPRWRGAAPIQRAIMAGDAEAGVTIMRVTEKLDTGPVLLARAVPIGPGTTAGALHDDLAHLGGELMAEALEGLAAGSLEEKPQPEAGVTYAAKITADDERLDWTLPAADLERRVRALSPRPGAWFELPGKARIKVLAAIAEAGEEKPPGTTVDDALGIQCGAGVLRPTRVQRAGKAAQETGAFLRGAPVAPGTRLG